MSLEDVFTKIGANHDCDDELQRQILEDFLTHIGQLESFTEYATQWAKEHPEKIYNHSMSDEICECGHPYHRHFDGYEDNYHIGCKYCECYDFKPVTGSVTQAV
jgi:hypothetical protein